MTQQRQPKGIPTGGQFAAGIHEEASGVTLTEPRPFPLPFPGTERDSLAEQIAYEADVAQALGADPLHADSEPSWSKLTRDCGEAHAEELFERTGGDLDDARVAAEEEWAAIAPVNRQKLIDAGVKPSDFASPDRDVRMWACMERGDLVFEDELVSDAYALSRHGVHGGEHRVIAVPGQIANPMTGERVSWADLDPQTQLAYLDGYAAGVQATGHIQGALGPEWQTGALRDRGQKLGAHTAAGKAYRLAGWRRAYYAERFADDVRRNGGSGYPYVEIYESDTPGQRLRVTDVQARSDATGDYFVGRIESGQQRFGANGTHDRSPGSTVRFEVDQYLPGGF